LNEKRKALFFTVLAGMLWGTSFPSIKIGLNYIDAYMFAFLRFFSASAIMFIILLVTKKLDFKFAKKRSVWFLGVLNGFSYLLQYVGMTFTTASISSLLVNLTAVWVAIISWFLLKERFGNKKLLGIIISIIGVFLITTNLNFLELTKIFFGDILVLFSGIGWAFFISYSKKFIVDSENSLQFMSWVLFVTVLPLIPFISFSSHISLNFQVEAWILIGYTAVFCWIVPYWVWLKGLKHLSSTTSTIILLTEPIVAIIISHFILGEVFTLISGTGALLILLAIVLVSLEK